MQDWRLSIYQLREKGEGNTERFCTYFSLFVFIVSRNLTVTGRTHLAGLATPSVDSSRRSLDLAIVGVVWSKGVCILLSVTSFLASVCFITNDSREDIFEVEPDIACDILRESWRPVPVWCKRHKFPDISKKSRERRRQVRLLQFHNGKNVECNRPLLDPFFVC